MRFVQVYFLENRSSVMMFDDDGKDALRFFTAHLSPFSAKHCIIVTTGGSSLSLLYACCALTTVSVLLTNDVTNA